MNSKIYIGIGVLSGVLAVLSLGAGLEDMNLKKKTEARYEVYFRTVEQRTINSKGGDEEKKFCIEKIFVFDTETGALKSIGKTNQEVPNSSDSGYNHNFDGRSFDRMEPRN